jgi:hypothetical protein
MGRWFQRSRTSRVVIGTVIKKQLYFHVEIDEIMKEGNEKMKQKRTKERQPNTKYCISFRSERSENHKIRPWFGCRGYERGQDSDRFDAIDETRTCCLQPSIGKVFPYS